MRSVAEDTQEIGFRRATWRKRSRGLNHSCHWHTIPPENGEKDDQPPSDLIELRTLRKASREIGDVAKVKMKRLQAEQTEERCPMGGAKSIIVRSSNQQLHSTNLRSRPAYVQSQYMFIGFILIILLPRTVLPWRLGELQGSQQTPKDSNDKDKATYGSARGFVQHRRPLESRETGNYNWCRCYLVVSPILVVWQCWSRFGDFSAILSYQQTLYVSTPSRLKHIGETETARRVVAEER